MPPERDHPGTPTPPRNGYFVIHASAIRKDGDVELNGMMEDLTTGEKQVFDSAADVTRLMQAWASKEVAPARVPKPPTPKE